ncbi:MAG: S4 domain-containing protein [Candidatus Eisenbacteria bacterium]
MRLDLVLNHLCVFATRSQAGKACDGGRVWVNGEAARASRPVHVGDVIRFRFPGALRGRDRGAGGAVRAGAEIRALGRCSGVLERRRIENPRDE